MTTQMTDIRQTIEEAQDEIRREWGADEVGVHGSGFSLRWENEEEKTIVNARSMVEELQTLAENYPGAEVHASADLEGFSVSAWFPEEDAVEGDNDE